LLWNSDSYTLCGVNHCGVLHDKNIGEDVYKYCHTVMSHSHPGVLEMSPNRDTCHNVSALVTLVSLICQEMLVNNLKLIHVLVGKAVIVVNSFEKFAIAVTGRGEVFDWSER